MKKFGVFLLSAIFSLSITNVGVNAVDVTTSPIPPVYGPVFVTGFEVSNQLDVFELYNESDEPVNLTDWSIEYKSVGGGSCRIKLQDWVLPSGYVTGVADGGPLATLIYNPNVFAFKSCIHEPLDSFVITLTNNGGVLETITPSYTVTPAAFVRKGLTKTYRSGKFATDFVPINRSLYAGEWYRPMQSSELQISEILVNSRSCSPLETKLDCSDYVKLYNPTSDSIDLSNFRLRNGYFGQEPTSSNTTILNGILQSGHYTTITTNVTDGGGWLWLEDVYGVKRYDNTVQGYPDGSSDTKVGQAWAYDNSDGNWKWTTQPNPEDSPSIFPVFASVTITADDSMAPCKVGQYRSLETNRCRNIVSDLNVLIPCDEGKERNPITNRCYTPKVSVNTLEPCKEGQERNAKTNRCRNIESTVDKVGYAPEKTKENDTTSWWPMLAVFGLGIGYGIWEWRHEISKLISKILSVFRSSGKLGS